MSAQVKADVDLEIAHILFIDAVGYSKLSINEQRKLADNLNAIVRGSSCFRAAEAAGKLIRLPTGDGMALVFAEDPRRQCDVLWRSVVLHENQGCRFEWEFTAGQLAASST